MKQERARRLTVEIRVTSDYAINRALHEKLVGSLLFLQFIKHTSRP